MNKRYVKMLLTFWFLEKGSFKGIRTKGTLFSDIEKAYEESNFDNILDFMYDAIGYRDDSFYSSKERANRRKEIAINENYEKDLSKEFNCTRSSQLIELLDSLKILGVNKRTENIDTVFNKKKHKTIEKKFREFCKENNELVDLFCQSADLFMCNLQHEGKPVTYKFIKNYSNFSTYSEYLEVLNDSLGGDANNILGIVPSNRNEIQNCLVLVEQSILDKWGTWEVANFLLLAYLVFGKIQNLDNQYLTYVKRCSNIITASESAILDLIDVSNILFSEGRKETPKKLLQGIGCRVNSIEAMVESTNGVYQVVDIYGKEVVIYVPRKYQGDSEGVCLYVGIEDFVNLVNTGDILNINVIMGIPYIDGIRLDDAGYYEREGMI